MRWSNQSTWSTRGKPANHTGSPTRNPHWLSECSANPPHNLLSDLSRSHLLPPRYESKVCRTNMAASTRQGTCIYYAPLRPVPLLTSPQIPSTREVRHARRVYATSHRRGDRRVCAGGGDPVRAHCRSPRLPRPVQTKRRSWYGTRTLVTVS